MGALEELVASFSEQLIFLKRVSSLRIDENHKHMIEDDLSSLNHTVEQLEVTMHKLRASIIAERTAMPHVRNLIESCHKQREYLARIETNLPTYLPSLTTGSGGGSGVVGGGSGGGGGGSGGAVSGRVAASHAAAPSHPQSHPQSQSQPNAASKAPPRLRSLFNAPTSSTTDMDADDGFATLSIHISEPSSHPLPTTSTTTTTTSTTLSSVPMHPPPRRFVTQTEASSLPSYMTNGGRINADRLNASLDELAVLAESRLHLMRQARDKSTKLNNRDLTYARDLLLNVQGHESVKGKHFVLESDLKRGQLTKLDQTGKAVMQALRKLGRVGEVRCQLSLTDTSSINVIVLL